MTPQTINVDLPADILLTLNETEQELITRIKCSLAIQLYTQQKVTLGKAAQIAKMSKFQFEALLSQNNLPIPLLNVDEVLNDATKII